MNGFAGGRKVTEERKNGDFEVEGKGVVSLAWPGRNPIPGSLVRIGTFPGILICGFEEQMSKDGSEGWQYLYSCMLVPQGQLD